MEKEIDTKKVEKFVKPFYAARDPMHNWNHIQRIQKKVSVLKKQYKNINNDFLNFLIYFHGSRKWAKKNKKAIVNLGYPTSWINKINQPTTLEGKIVWDANYIENVGYFGIKKTLALEEYYLQTRKETLNLAQGFLQKYKFYTPLGKKLGNKGIQIKREWMKKELSKINKKAEDNKELVVCLVSFKHKLLIIRRSINDVHGGKWDFPGGSLFHKEEADKGMEREIKEEIGIPVKDLRRIAINEFIHKKRYYLIIFYKAEITKSKVKLSKEHDNYKWINKKLLFDYSLNPIIEKSKLLLSKELK